MSDDQLCIIGLGDANVHARWSTHVESAITDANGYFRTGSFIFDANYAIKWDRYNYSIRSDRVGQTWYNGPKHDDPWYLYIGVGTQVFYATIHRAACYYYYGNIGDLTRRPSGNSFWRPQVKIAAIDEPNNEPTRTT